MTASKRRALIVCLSIVATFIALRVYLHLSPSSNFAVGPYNIHHLFTGVLLIVLGGIPLAIFHGKGLLLDLSAALFGIGLSMALDEWVYLITTDGSDTSYLLPISLWGGVVMVGLAAVYVLGLLVYAARCHELR